MNQPNRIATQDRNGDEATFRIVLKGIQPDAVPADARARLAALFDTTAAKIDVILASPDYVLKKSISNDVASRYKTAIEAAGGICEVVPEDAPAISLDIDLPGAGSIAAPAQASGVAPAAPAASKPNPASTIFCRGCGKQIHASAPACPACGAPQAVPATKGSVQQGAAVKQGKIVYASYDQVPWYRKNWFAIACALLFSPALMVLLLTGDIYYLQKGQLKTYSKGVKIFFVAWFALVLLSFFFG